MNASEPREDAVADAFRALDEAIAYEGDCTARKGLRKARETFAALAQQGAVGVCHRTVTPQGPWQWMSGPPSLGALDNLKVHPSWRIEYAYAPATGAPR